MGLRQKATRGLTWSLIERWGNELLALGIFVVLSRHLDPAAFGLVALANVVIDFARRFVDQGFSEAVVQRGELDREHLDTAFWTGIVTGALLSALCVGSRRLRSQRASASRSSRRCCAGSRSSSWSAACRARSRRSWCAACASSSWRCARSWPRSSVPGSVGVSIALAGFGVWSLVGQSLAAGVFGVVTLWSVSDWRPGFGFRWSHFRELSLFGANIVGFKLLNLLSQRIDTLLIGGFLGAVALGYYSVALRISHAITKILTGVMNAVAFPVFSRLQGDAERMRRAFYEATQLTSLVTLPAFLGHRGHRTRCDPLRLRRAVGAERTGDARAGRRRACCNRSPSSTAAC